MKRRKAVEIVCYDYTCKEEYEKHIPIMRKNGWLPCENTGFDLNPSEIRGSNKYFYCAYFFKSCLD